jgi:hypothetical protein
VSEDHWRVRREAASLLAAIVRQFAAPHHNLQPRLCRVLGQALLDADKPLTSKYGAVVGMQVRDAGAVLQQCLSTCSGAVRKKGLQNFALRPAVLFTHVATGGLAGAGAR